MIKNILFCLLLVLLLPALAVATDRYVDNICTNGTTTYSPVVRTCVTGTSTVYSTISNGISAMVSGDRLYIRGGTYHERINTVAQFIPSGSSWATATTISAYPGETVWLDGTSATNIPLINMANMGSVNPTMRYIIFDGINLDCVNVGGGNGCVGTGNDGAHPSPDHIRWQNYEAKNTNSSNNLPGGYAPAHIINGSFHEFINCNVHDNGRTIKPVDGFAGYAFYINGSDHVIDNCQLHDNGGYGAQIYRSGGGADRITLKNSKIYRNSLNSTSTTGGIIVGSGSGHKIFNNIIYDNYDGIEVSFACTDCVIYNNTIYNHKSAGITIAAGVVRPIITNNIIVTSGTVNSAPNISDEGASSPSFNSNLCYDSGGTAHCSVTSNPLFTDAANGDFRLQAGSPAIDVGAINISPGNVIPACSASIVANCYNGKLPDLGAIESGASPAGGPPTLTPIPSIVAANGSVSVNVKDDDVNERIEETGDWLGIYVPGTVSFDALDWFYMNGSKTAPLTAISDALIAFTAPATPGSYEFRFYRNGSDLEIDRLATVGFTVIAPGIVMKFNISALKIGPSVTWKIGTP